MNSCPFIVRCVRRLRSHSHLRTRPPSQLTIGDFIVVTEQQGEMDLSGFSAAGGYIELDHILYEGVAQSGESLIVQALAGATETEEAFSDRLRFIDILDGRPSTWAGPHAPSRNQPWRLWYRIEAGAPKPAPVYVSKASRTQ